MHKRPDSKQWHAISTRDGTAPWFYGVTTTRIYCRPGCGARTPLRANAIVFALPEVADAAGYRACRRCRPDCGQATPDVQSLRNLCRQVARSPGRRWTLAAGADVVASSPSALHRRFLKTTGITFKHYVEAVRSSGVRQRLRDGSSVRDATFASGFRSTSRTYGVVRRGLGMTPGQYSDGGAGHDITFAISSSQMGTLLVASTASGICAVRLGDDAYRLEDELKAEFSKARVTRADARLRMLVANVLQRISGHEPTGALPLDVQATAFQRQVWNELQRVPRGETVSYADLARSIGRPEAVRAVAGAVARNPVAIVVPCHRVVRSDGGLGGYRWGTGRKKALLDAESKDGAP